MCISACYLIAAFTIIDALGFLLSSSCLCLLTLPLLFLLLIKLLDALLQNIGPKISFKIGNLGSTGHIALYGILENILKNTQDCLEASCTLSLINKDTLYANTFYRNKKVLK